MALVFADIHIFPDRSGSSSPSPRPSESKGSAFDLPGVPHASDSPSSSAPSTPNEESQKRAGTVAIGSEDYFMSALRLRQDSKGSPGTPHGGKRNATFSPRIVFFETWPSQEYDRRGEIATCNRLTPMLAQQIKEELNSFKMASNTLGKQEVGRVVTNIIYLYRRWKFTRTRRFTLTSFDDQGHGQRPNFSTRFLLIQMRRIPVVYLPKIYISRRFGSA